MRCVKILVPAVAGLLAMASTAMADILVYDQNTNNSYAQAAAAGLGEPVTVAGSSDFNTELTSQSWSLVLVDCPSTTPSGGWTDLVNYVNGGGKAVMSFWDWDNNSGAGDAGLAAAFGFTGTSSFELTDGVDTLTAAPTSAGNAVFAGNPGMPHSDWFNTWGDDGDAFTFTGGQAVAYFDFSPDPVTIINNTGNAIATFLVDEWDGPGAEEFWTGMANAALFGVEQVSVPSTTWTGNLLLALLISVLGLAVLRRH